MIGVSIFNDEVSHDFPEALQMLSSWGQPLVDLREYIFGDTFIDNITGEQREELAVLLSQYQFDIGCLGTRKLVADPGADQQETLLLLERLIKTAKLVKTPYIRVCNAAPRPPEEAERVKMLIPAAPLLRHMADIAAESGITLLLENKPTSLTNRGSEMAAFLETVKHPSVKVVWDAVNSWIGGYYNVEKDYNDCKEYLGVVHLKGAMGKKDAPHIYDRGGVMGQDEFPHRQIVERLVRDHYEGNITLDLSIGSIRKDEFPLSRGEIARISLDYTRKLVESQRDDRR